MRPGGLFVTEQVGYRTNLEIHDLFGHERPAAPDPAPLEGVRAAAERAGFYVAQAGEAFPVWRYTDVGCLVYYLKCISWEIPDFSVDRYRNVLLSLHKRMRTDGTPFEARLHLFYLGLQKPGGGGEPIL